MLRVIIYILLTGLLACGPHAAQDPAAAATPAKPSPVLYSYTGNKPLRLADYQGKVVVLNFWATWCKPCLAEMPSMAGARDSLAGKPVVFLFATDEEKAEVEAFEKSNGFGFTYVKVNNMAELGIAALPVTFIYDPAGNLVYTQTGIRKWDDPTHLTMILKALQSK